jgi:hypothetical protein
MGRQQNISQVRQLSRKVRDLSAYQAKQRDATTPLPAPFYSSAPVAKKAKKVVYSRQLQPDDAFYGAYDRLGLIVPPYSPTQLYSIYESSSILSPHIDALIQNVTGFDIPFKYIGPAGESLLLFFARQTKVNRLGRFVRLCGSITKFWDTVLWR